MDGRACSGGRGSGRSGRALHRIAERRKRSHWILLDALADAGDDSPGSTCRSSRSSSGAGDLREVARDLVLAADAPVPQVVVETAPTKVHRGGESEA